MNKTLDTFIKNNLIKGFHPYYKEEPSNFKEQTAYYNGKYHEGIWVIGFPTIVNGKPAIKGFPCREFEKTPTEKVLEVILCSFENDESPFNELPTVTLFVEPPTISKFLGTTDKTGHLIFENDILLDQEVGSGDPDESYKVVRFGRVYRNKVCFYTTTSDIKGHTTSFCEKFSTEPIVCGNIFADKVIYKRNKKVSNIITF